MTIEQTVEIPASRRFTIDLPPESPVGRAQFRLELRFLEEFAPEFDSLSRASVEWPAKRLDEPLQSTEFDPIKAQEAIDALCGMGQTDGHNVDRFLAWKQADREHEWEIEQQQEEEHKIWRKQ